jgi:hypothetical protein
MNHVRPQNKANQVVFERLEEKVVMKVKIRSFKMAYSSLKE